VPLGSKINFIHCADYALLYVALALAWLHVPQALSNNMIRRTWYLQVVSDKFSDAV